MPDTPIADSVRTALPREAPELAALQRRAWQHTEVGAAALGSIDLAAMTEQWHAAIDRPPLAECRVLVALGDGVPVGFATTSPNPDADAEPGVDGMVGEFVVDPRATGRGHGSRLLNACVDTLRADGFTRASCWVGSTDDRLRGFLVSAGWAPDGAHRELGSEDGPTRVRQVRLHTDITVEASTPEDT